MAKKKDEEQTGGVDSSLEDAPGYLPGTAPKVIPSIIKRVKLIETQLKPAFGAARDALKNEKLLLSNDAHKHIEHFSEPDENGTRIYEAGGVRVEIAFEKETINTKIVNDEE